MSAPFKIPDRNAPYRSSKSPYEGFWQSTGRERATTVPHPTISRFPQPFGFQGVVQQEPKVPNIQISQTQSKKAPKNRTQDEEKASQNVIIKQLAKKTKKQVREWFREQVETLDDSESD